MAIIAERTLNTHNSKRSKMCDCTKLRTILISVMNVFNNCKDVLNFDLNNPKTRFLINMELLRTELKELKDEDIGEYELLANTFRVYKPKNKICTILIENLNSPSFKKYFELKYSKIQRMENDFFKILKDLFEPFFKFLDLHFNMIKYQDLEMNDNPSNNKIFKELKLESKIIKNIQREKFHEEFYKKDVYQHLKCL
jgi:hypothetical protein